MRGKFDVEGIQRTLLIRGVIRKETQKSADLFGHGFEFSKEDENGLFVLFGFMFNAMAFDKIQKIC